MFVKKKETKKIMSITAQCQGLFVAHINCVLTWVSSSLWFSMYKLPVFIDFFKENKHINQHKHIPLLQMHHIFIGELSTIATLMYFNLMAKI